MSLSAGIQEALDALSRAVDEHPGATLTVQIEMPQPQTETLPLTAWVEQTDGDDGDSAKESGLKRDAARADDCVAQRDVINAVELAQFFHDRYETLAPLFRYQTRPESRVHWDYVPEDNKALMIAVAAAVIAKFGLNR